MNGPMEYEKQDMHVYVILFPSYEMMAWLETASGVAILHVSSEYSY